MGPGARPALLAQPAWHASRPQALGHPGICQVPHAWSETTGTLLDLTFSLLASTVWPTWGLEPELNAAEEVTVLKLSILAQGCAQTGAGLPSSQGSLLRPGMLRGPSEVGTEDRQRRRVTGGRVAREQRPPSP